MIKCNPGEIEYELIYSANKMPVLPESKNLIDFTEKEAKEWCEQAHQLGVEWKDAFICGGGGCSKRPCEILELIPMPAYNCQTHKYEKDVWRIKAVLKTETPIGYQGNIFTPFLGSWYLELA